MVALSDIKFYKSVYVTNTTSNGGRRSTNQVTLGVRHNLFPRVTSSERSSGTTRYRKQFWSNMNASDETAYGTLIKLGFPSPGGDRFYLSVGTARDTQSDIVSTTDPPAWYGVGQLNVALNGGETSIQLQMEANDFIFPNGGYLFISNAFATGQIIDAGVKVGDSVSYSGGTWYKITATNDIEYPNGLYVGSNIVMTYNSSNEEWLLLADNEYTDEDIGTGDGSDTSPTLSTLINNTNGICTQRDLRPIVTATCGGVSRTVNVAADGTCSGYCTAGELNMADGSWITDITWSTAPDNGTDILIDYRENCYNYSGTVATVYLETGEQVAGAYLTANTYGAGCINAGDIAASSDSWIETSVSGTYDESTYPPTLTNKGTVEDDWTITFTSAVAFTCSGTYTGSVGSGAITADFSPINGDTSVEYFTLASAGWGGTWAAGDTVTFTTHASDEPIWMKETVPAGCGEETDNLIPIRFYTE